MQWWKKWQKTADVQQKWAADGHLTPDTPPPYTTTTEVRFEQGLQHHHHWSGVSLYFITHRVWRTVSRNVLLEFSLYHIASNISLLHPPSVTPTSHLSPPHLTTKHPPSLFFFFFFFVGGEKKKWNNFVVGSPGGFLISCLCMIILCCPASRNSGLPNADRW